MPPFCAKPVWSRLLLCRPSRRAAVDTTWLIVTTPVPPMPTITILPCGGTTGSLGKSPGGISARPVFCWLEVGIDLDRYERRTVSIEAGEVKVARLLMDLSLAAKGGSSPGGHWRSSRSRHSDRSPHRSTRRSSPEWVGVTRVPRLRPPTKFGSARLVVDENGYPRYVAEFALHIVELVAAGYSRLTVPNERRRYSVRVRPPQQRSARRPRRLASGSALAQPSHQAASWPPVIATVPL